MNITHEDLQRARRISRAIQEYFEMTHKEGIRSTDIYPFLAKKGIIEKDRHNGLHFRRFLIKLKENNLLNLIPQCICNPGLEIQFNEWYFYRDNNLHNNSKKNQPENKEDIKLIVPNYLGNEIDEFISRVKPQVNLLLKRDVSTFTIQEKELRQNYPRAYERWTKKEIEILKMAFKELNQIDKIAFLLERQPSAVERKLREYGII